MDMSHHTRLYTDNGHIVAIHNEGLVRSVMTAFEALNRQRWSAPWNTHGQAAPRR